MSLNKYIHPRNRYKTIPDFKKLAAENEDFTKHCKMGLSGKIHYDFYSKDAVIYLAALLLKLDFNLNVHIPKDTLTPSIPGRLNYVLWIEDIFSKLNIERKLFGVDIGCGAAGIFSLLIARMYEWNMLGTEINDESVIIANQNVNQNNLQHLVKILKVPPSCYLIDALENEVNYDFCMCNPPFFASEAELNMESKSRSKERKSHSNCQTGLKEEIITPGGEVQFVKNIIADSNLLKDRIKVYTVMLGHKKSVPVILRELDKLAGVRSIGRAQFCQGNTMRWGVAWSFCLSSIYSFLPVDDESKRKNRLLQMNFKSKYDEAEQCFEMIDRHLENNLQLERKLIARDDTTYGLTLTAYENTWSKQRRKRREMTRMQKQPDCSKDSNNLIDANNYSAEVNQSKPVATVVLQNEEIDESSINCSDTVPTIASCNELTLQSSDAFKNINNNNNNNTTRLSAEDTKNHTDNLSFDRKRSYLEMNDNTTAEFTRSNKVLKMEHEISNINHQGRSNDPLLKIDLIVTFNSQDKTLALQAKTLHGEKVLTGQILQYFKNNFCATE